MGEAHYRGDTVIRCVLMAHLWRHVIHFRAVQLCACVDINCISEGTRTYIHSIPKKLSVHSNANQSDQFWRYLYEKETTWTTRGTVLSYRLDCHRATPAPYFVNRVSIKFYGRFLYPFAFMLLEKMCGMVIHSYMSYQLCFFSMYLIIMHDDEL